MRVSVTCLCSKQLSVILHFNSTVYVSGLLLNELCYDV